MSVAQMVAIKYELAHAIKTCADPQRRVRLLLKMAALDERIKLGLRQGWQSGSKRRVYAQS
jgi:hypothetical protein